MKSVVEQRAIELAEYIVENKTTVRAAAKKFGISKSTVHMDVSNRLKNLNPSLREQENPSANLTKALSHQMSHSLHIEH